MDNEIDVNVIHDSRLGGDLSEAECAALGAVMGVHELADGAVLAQEGDSDQSLYLLARGSLNVSRQDGETTQHLHTMHEGELAGVTGLLSDASHRTTLRASGDIVVYSLKREALESLLEDHPSAVYKVMRSIARSAYGIVSELGGQIEQLVNYVTKTHGRY